MRGGSVNSHVKAETQAVRYIRKLIKKIGIVKEFFPLIGNKRGNDI